MRRFFIILFTALFGIAIAIVAGIPAKAGTQTIAPTADTYVELDKSTTNFGTSIRWSTEGRSSITRNALLKFDVTVPIGERIVSAKIRAYSEAATTSTEFVNLYSTANAWTETGVTWQNQPARGTFVSRTAGFAINTWAEWDVTSVLTAGTNSFKLETAAQKWVGFTSKEGTNAALRPQLVLVTQPNTVTPPPTTTPPTTPPVTGDGTTAASTFNWGSVVTGDEFNYTGAPDSTKWDVYSGPGHAGNGLRSPSQVAIDGTKMVMSGTANGTTGGMSAKFANQKYGRWEIRAAASGDNEYHMVSILWPDSQNWPCDGEIDYAETTGSFSIVNFFHHYSCANSQTSSNKAIDVTQFHNYAVDWSPTGITGYVDGVKWFEDVTPAHQPPGSMHQTLQLDWFPDATADGTGQMLVDWVRVYAAAGTTPPPSTPPTPPAPTTGAFNFAAVGDMNPSGNTSTTSASGKNASSIIGSLNDGSIDNFLALGDFQYEKGTCTALSAWNTLWGGAKAKTFWTAGPNHDIDPAANDDVDRFMDGQCLSTTKSATSTTLGRFQDALEWYSFDKGNWHILVAPTATWYYNATRANAMTAEMDTDLKNAKAAGKHLAVIYHDPYFTSNTSVHTRFTQAKPWIDMFWANRVKVLLSGSQHNYERTCPVNNVDQCVPDGMQQFQVSTGGIGLRAFTSAPAYVQKKFSDTWGHLRMSLKADGSYTWEFRPVAGNMANTDSGSRAAG
jgi:hypothetical protein